MSKEKLYIGIAMLAIGVGMIGFGLYEWMAATFSGTVLTYGMDAIPYITIVVFGIVMIGVGVAMLNSAQKKVVAS